MSNIADWIMNWSLEQIKPCKTFDKYSLTGNNIAFHVLVLRATTHTDLVLRASQENIPYKVIHNASIMNAIGCCGLQVWFVQIIVVIFWCVQQFASTTHYRWCSSFYCTATTQEIM